MHPRPVSFNKRPSNLFCLCLFCRSDVKCIPQAVTSPKSPAAALLTSKDIQYHLFPFPIISRVYSQLFCLDVNSNKAYVLYLIFLSLFDVFCCSIMTALLIQATDLLV